MGFDLEEIKTKKTFIGLGLGQILSLLLTCNVFTSSELVRKGINAPTTQSFLSYMLIAIVYGCIMLYQRPTIKVSIEIVFSDVHAGSRGGGSNPVKGDVLVIAGATLYAVSNTSEEFLVKSADTVELITFMGLFGAIISGIQTCILEHDELKAIDWSAEVVQLVV